MRILATLFTLFVIGACQTKTMQQEKISSLVFRLKPGEDLKAGIEKQVKENNIKAGWVSTCVGSLTDFSLRFANMPNPSNGQSHYEIISLVGTVSVNGSHLHLSISDSAGTTIGGHLMPGCKIYTTAEIVLLYSDKYDFIREKDGTTDWEELQIKEK